MLQNHMNDEAKLQAFYTVLRKGYEVRVPIDNLTASEVIEIVERLNGAAAVYTDHGDALERNFQRLCQVENDRVERTQDAPAPH